MTAEEAIKEFRERIEFGKKEYLKYIPEYIEALEMAIEALEKVEEYKHLEEQGLLLRLPCKVGDKLYAISDTRIAECTCCEIKIGIENYVGANFNCDYDCKGCPFNSWEQDFYTGEHSCSGEYGDWYFVLDDFGKTVFLTKEEAEAKLKEMEG